MSGGHGPVAEDARDPQQMALWVHMSDLAKRYDDASWELLGGVPKDLILALVEAGPALSPERRALMIAAGALILRLIQVDAHSRAQSTGRMLSRLGLPANVTALGEQG